MAGPGCDPKSGSKALLELGGDEQELQPREK